MTTERIRSTDRLPRFESVPKLFLHQITARWRHRSVRLFVGGTPSTLKKVHRRSSVFNRSAHSIRSILSSWRPQSVAISQRLFRLRSVLALRIAISILRSLRHLPPLGNRYARDAP